MLADRQTDRQTDVDHNNPHLYQDGVNIELVTVKIKNALDKITVSDGGLSDILEA